jgi:uncharacterized protein
MTEPSYRRQIRQYIERQAIPREKFGHQPRLYALAKEIGAGHSYDDDIVFAAVWLHDLGVFTGHRPEDPAVLAQWNHVPYTMERAQEVLLAHGFPEAKIPAVVEAIRTHQPAFEPETIESIIVRDADILEQLGAIAVLRTVCKVGRDTRFSLFTEAVNSLRHSLDTLPDRIRLENTKKMANPKIEALRAFLKAVDAESYGALW